MSISIHEHFYAALRFCFSLNRRLYTTLTQELYAARFDEALADNLSACNAVNGFVGLGRLIMRHSGIKNTGNFTLLRNFALLFYNCSDN